MARKWRRCAVPDPCAVPWGEGSRGVGVGARGSCQGGGARFECGVGPRGRGDGGCFDRLRANGFGRGACGGEWGMRWGTETPRAAPLPWVPARAGTTMGGVVGCVGARGWCQGGGPLSRAGGSRTAPTTGVGRTRAGVMRGLLVEGPLRPFDRLRANGFGRGACGGEWGMRWGGTETPRAAPLRVGALDSCLRRNDATWGCATRARVCGGCWGGGPFDRLRANGFGRGACGGEWGMRWGTGDPAPRPFWFPSTNTMTRMRAKNTRPGSLDMREGRGGHSG